MITFCPSCGNMTGTSSFCSCNSIDALKERYITEIKPYTESQAIGNGLGCSFDRYFEELSRTYLDSLEENNKSK